MAHRLVAFDAFNGWIVDLIVRLHRKVAAEAADWHLRLVAFVPRKPPDAPNLRRFTDPVRSGK